MQRLFSSVIELCDPPSTYIKINYSFLTNYTIYFR